ncbi:MAG: HDOD domain-containing protein [Gammaproteobacteria bacterium]|nr:HDOD domain-containing protein [Gammaproteobacteria bacterium]
MVDTKIQILIDKAGSLASLPDIFFKVNELVNDARSSASDIGRAIEQDAALSARLLKIVNSPYYNFPSSIDTISRAITIIGTRDLRDLVLATTVTRTFSGMDNDLIDMEKYWRHNLYCAVAGRILAQQRHVKNTERLFVAGLLHDIGSLVMYQTIPELSNEALQRTQSDGTPLYIAEKEIIGFSHGDVGAALLQKWKLPDSLIETVKYHHEPELAENHREDVATIHIADYIANSIDEDSNRCGVITPLDERTWATTGLSLEVLDTALCEITDKFLEMHSLLFPTTRAA